MLPMALLAVFCGAGAMLPGEVPGVVVCAACGAPVGAGGVVAALSDGFGAIIGWVVLPALPGDMPGAAMDGAFGAPVGAGLVVAVCAKAAPEQMMKAAEASKSERITVSLSCFLSFDLGSERGWGARGTQGFWPLGQIKPLYCSGRGAGSEWRHG
jgi:hypothetical protein